MATKKILGLDLGTNSIGWAVVNAETTDKGLQPTSIAKAGSRIIPMDAALQGDFESGNSISQTANRTAARGVRRLFERRALRRERLNRVLNLMGFLPQHYSKHLNRYGQLNKGQEPKIAWCTDENEKMQFLFQSSFDEMVKEFNDLGVKVLTLYAFSTENWSRPEDEVNYLLFENELKSLNYKFVGDRFYSEY